MEDRRLLLERFHVALVASIERANPSFLRESFTVGQIYEDLIPYRTHRDLIGVAMNGDYEDGLMRLLAGEGEYVILESPEALEVIQGELGKKAPDTGLYKKFRDVSVRLNSEQLGITAPESRGSGVARLFEQRSGEVRPAAPPAQESRNGWGLGEAGVDASPPETRDEVQRPDTFWEERRAKEGEEDEATDPPGERVGHLEAENRRLKILLAERVLEVEELRERLSQGKTGARRDKS